MELLSMFVWGEESFFTLLRDPNHLMFEAVTGILQTVVIDVLLLAFVWPVIRRHIHRDVKHGAEHVLGKPLSTLNKQCVDVDAYEGY